MKSSTIQIIVTGVFILFAIVGVIVFSVTGSDKKRDDSANAEVSVWGTLPEDGFNSVIANINTEVPGTIRINYTFKTAEEIETDLTNAILDKTAVPDGLIISHDLLIKFQKRLTLISWTAVSERDLKDNYSQAGEVFFTGSGTYAIPFLVDPLVLYWNRDMFNSQGIASPPLKWEDLSAMVTRFTEKNENRTIKKSAIALGEYQNISHAKAILSALSLQVGGQFVARVADTLDSQVFKKAPGFSDIPLESALSFYTQFANPASQLYSWSRAMPDAQLTFLQGDSAMYIGFGSEAGELRTKNPNLNFDIAFLPQAKSSGLNKATYGDVYGIAIVNESIYKEAMLKTALQLTSSKFQALFAETQNRAPVRRDMLAVPPGTGLSDIIWKSALWTKSWLDPDKNKTDNLFKIMIESVTSGRVRVSDAVVTFSDQLNQTIDE